MYSTQVILYLYKFYNEGIQKKHDFQSFLYENIELQLYCKFTKRKLEKYYRVIMLYTYSQILNAYTTHAYVVYTIFRCIYALRSIGVHCEHTIGTLH